MASLVLRRSRPVGTRLVLALAAAATWSSAAAATAPVFDEQEAIAYAEFARVAFCEKENVQAWSCGEQCEGAAHGLERPQAVTYITAGASFDVPGYVAQLNAGRCVLAFRGSVSPGNWAADANAPFTDWPPAERPGKAHWCANCRVHSGFAAAYEEIRLDVLRTIAALQCTNVAVTGHSLGAAVATLAALDLRGLHPKAAEQGLRVHPFYTYGSPRVGNERFVEVFATQAAAHSGGAPPQWRVVHYHDPVPHLPMSWLGYVHIPQEVYYTNEESSEYKVCDGSGEDPTCSDSVYLFQCINFDHINYFNRSFAMKSMDPACTQADGGREKDVINFAATDSAARLVAEEADVAAAVRIWPAWAPRQEQEVALQEAKPDALFVV